MLQSIHDRSQGWIVWIIFGLIILTFALWGVQSYLGVNEQPAVAVVGDVKITQSQYQRSLQQQRQRFQAMLGANYDPKLFDTPSVRRNVAEQLIDDTVVNQFMYDSGMRVGDRQIGQYIVSIPQFQQDGKFSEDLFNRYLNSQGQSQESFFALLSNDIMHTQLTQGVAGSGLRTPVEAGYQSRLIGQQRDIGYILFPYTKYLSGIQVDDKEIQQYYQSNPQPFMTNEKVAVEYIDLSLQSLAQQIHVTDKEVRDYYKQNQAQYVAPEQRRASHILIQVPKNADAKAVEAARNKAADILKKIRGGASFATMAKKYSQDVGSAKQGGDLGYFVPGTMTKAFDEKVFSMKKGQVSEPVRTEFGFHIIKLTDIKKESTSFEKIKNRVKADYKKREAEKQYYDLSERLANIAYESPDSLLPAADETGLKIQSSELFSRDAAKGLMSNPKVLAKVFNPDVINTHENEVVDLGAEHTAVVRVKDHVPAKLKPLDQVRTDIVNLLKANKAREKARLEANKALARLQAGEAASKIASANKLKWHEAQLYTRRDTAKLNPDILHKAFTMPKSDKPAFATASLKNGDVALVAVDKVVEGDSKAAENAQISKRAKQQDGQLAYQELVSYLKDNADITRNFDTLK